jgi:hypothetical protein
MAVPPAVGGRQLAAPKAVMIANLANDPQLYHLAWLSHADDLSEHRFST